MSFECIDSVISPNSIIFDNTKIRRCTINDNATIGERCDISDCIIDTHAELGRNNLLRSVEIGYGSYTGTNTIIKKTKIGKYCSISWNVSIGGDNHPMECASMYSNYWWEKTFSQRPDRVEYSKETIIGNDVWIGANATILSGVKIEDGAVIGAGAVVTKNVPPYAIVAGVPAQIIKSRFSQDTINVLINIKWWNWSSDKIKEAVELLSQPLDETIMDKLVKMSENK